MQQTIKANSDIRDAELEVLKNIHMLSDHVRQRDLAKLVGLSLGMTNSIVKRLADKGWLKIRKVNTHNLRYAVSPAGIEQISRRSYRFFKRTIRSIVHYREAIETIVAQLKADGYSGLILVGRSDLDFIVEYACRTFAMEYVQDQRRAEALSIGDAKLYTFYAETYIPDEDEKTRMKNTAFLQEVLESLDDGPQTARALRLSESLASTSEDIQSQEASKPATRGKK